MNDRKLGRPQHRRRRNGGPAVAGRHRVSTPEDPAIDPNYRPTGARQSIAHANRELSEAEARQQAWWDNWYAQWQTS